MFAEEHGIYSLLHQNNRGSWSFDKKTLVLVSCLILPVILFCGTYMILFGVYEKVVYPKSYTVNEVPLKSLHRALVYNILRENASFTEIHMNATNVQPIRNFRLVCYYNFPSSKTSLQINEIDPNLCTHLNIAFGSVVNNSIYLDDFHLKYLDEIVKLKTKNENLKILLSLGGAGNENGFPEMVFNHSNRKTFIKSVLYYVKNHKIDGIDLDWEFPGEMNNEKQKMHFTQLLLELRKTVTRQPDDSFLITVAVGATSEVIDDCYDVSYMNDYVDFVNLMTYDYHFYTKVTPFTGINSPLYKGSNEKYYLATLNINYSSNYWNYLGMEKTKINIGLPTYGHTFRLANARNNGLYAPALGYGKLGTNGFTSFMQVCNFLSTNHISPVFDMENMSPYASKYSEWVSFDDDQSLTYKTEFIKNNNFGGAMVYCLNTDDFKGACKIGGKSMGKFPLTSKVKEVLNKKMTET